MGYHENKLRMEDMIQALILAYDIQKKVGPEEKEYRYLIPYSLSVKKDCPDATTNVLFTHINLQNLYNIQDMDVLCNECDDIVMLTISFREQCEMSEFVGHIYEYRKKGMTFWLKFTSFDKFENFFNRFMGKSMKPGTSYSVWEDPDATKEEITKGER